MTIFLTSDGFYNEEIKIAFKDLISDIHNAKVALVAITSYKKSKNNFDKIYNDFESIGISKEQIEFINLNAYAAKNLVNFDILFLDGGNPYQITSIYKNKGLDKIITKMHKENKIIIGVSGSAIALTPNLELMEDFIPQFNKNYLSDNLSALNIIENHVFPHYGRSDELFGDSTTIENKIKNFEKENNVKVLRLKDEDCKIIEV